VSFLLKVLDFIFFNAEYYWFYRSKLPLLCAVDYIMYCGFMFVGSAAYIWWSCFSHFIAVLDCYSAGRAVHVALCMRKLKNKQEVGWEEMFMAGLVPW